MKKLIQVLIVCGLLGMLLIGCGKSEAVKQCEKTSLKITAQFQLNGEMDDETREKVLNACSSYEGGASEEEVQKWIGSGGLMK